MLAGKISKNRGNRNNMRTIIAGGREVPIERGVRLVNEAILASGFEVTEIINGGAKGIDHAAREYWNRYYRGRPDGVPLVTVDAKWHIFGKSAGPLRNRQMAMIADALIAVWDGKSPGTKNMIETARKHGLQVYVHRYITNEDE